MHVGSNISCLNPFSLANRSNLAARLDEVSRKVWVRDWIRNRDRCGAYHQLMQELSLDVSSYCNFIRMNTTTFEELLGKVAPLITRRDTVMRQAIPPGERLALTLRFMSFRPMCVGSRSIQLL